MHLYVWLLGPMIAFVATHTALLWELTLQLHNTAQTVWALCVVCYITMLPMVFKLCCQCARHSCGLKFLVCKGAALHGMAALVSCGMSNPPQEMACIALPVSVHKKSCMVRD